MYWANLPGVGRGAYDGCARPMAANLFWGVHPAECGGYQPDFSCPAVTLLQSGTRRFPDD